MLILELIQNPLNLIAFLVALVVAITAHEFAHAYVAYKLGDPTAKHEGRVTLNPAAHLDPIGTIFLFTVGFGWGRPVPINPNYFQKKTDELKVAFAGIVTNLLLAFILAIPLRIAASTGQTFGSPEFLSFLNMIVELNIFLAAFNLLPIPPLDGSHLVEYFLNDEAKIQFQYFGPFVLIGIIALDYLTNVSVISLIMEPVIRLFSLLVKGNMIFGL